MTPAYATGGMESVGVPHRPEDIRRFKEGDVIFRKGDLGTHMYVLLKGLVQINYDDETVLSTVNPGGIFGEMALVDGGPRGGTAVALTDGEMLQFDENQFMALVKASPFFALKVLRTVVANVRQTDAILDKSKH